MHGGEAPVVGALAGSVAGADDGAPVEGTRSAPRAGGVEVRPRVVRPRRALSPKAEHEGGEAQSEEEKRPDRDEDDQQNCKEWGGEQRWTIGR